jgi:protease I
MLEGKRIAMLVEKDFEDAELIEPMRALHESGARVIIVGSRPGESYKGKKGTAEVTAETTADEVNVEDFDAVVVPGGYAPDKMRMHQSMIDLVRKAYEQGKVIAAICHGPQLLISADIIRGYRVTSWPSIEVDLRNAGAEWLNAPVVKDRNLITSRKPADLPRFNKTIIQTLQKQLRVVEESSNGHSNTIR